jgi:2-hydroxy-3-keto-5-methylthiopentenyl-1-phosphate phosphatase
MKRIFFLDFDGTITKTDTCNLLVETFAEDGWEDLNRLWEEKELSTEECANKTLKLFHASLDDLKKVLETVEIDDYFQQFLTFCQEKSYKVYVLSDGYDFNIETVFQKNGIELPYYSNKLVYDNGFKIECPLLNPSCGNCGTCKTTLMGELKEEGSQVIYIGDGYSDTCPAGHADLVFAKGALYKFCMGKGIKAVHFHSFNDIISYFSWEKGLG